MPRELPATLQSYGRLSMDPDVIITSINGKYYTFYHNTKEAKNPLSILIGGYE